MKHKMKQTVLAGFASMCLQPHNLTVKLLALLCPKLIQSRLQCTFCCVVHQVAHACMSWRPSFRVHIQHQCDGPWKHPLGRRHPVAPTTQPQRRIAWAVWCKIDPLRGSSRRQRKPNPGLWGEKVRVSLRRLLALKKKSKNLAPGDCCPWNKDGNEDD